MTDMYICQNRESPSVPDPFISKPPTRVSLISSKADSNTNRIGMSSILSEERLEEIRRAEQRRESSREGRAEGGEEKEDGEQERKASVSSKGKSMKLNWIEALTVCATD